MMTAIFLTAMMTDLSWLNGTWTGTHEGVEMEEVWIAPKGGLLLGVHRDVAGGKAVNFELLRIETGADGTLSYVSHPNGRTGVAFKLTKLEKRRAVFENPAHDFPTRITYWSDREGELCAAIDGPKAPSEKWCWKKK